MADQTTPVVEETPVVAPVEEIAPVVAAEPAAAVPQEVVAAPAAADAAPQEAPAVPLPADPAPVAVPADAVVPASAEAEAPAAEGGDKKRSTPEDGHADGAEAPAKKQRITRATIRKFLNKGKLLEHQIFTWRDWAPLDENEQSDVVFTGCKMKIEIKNTAGEVVLKPKQSVRRVEMYTSKSMVIFYPEGSIAGSIICPLQINVLTPVL